MEHNCNTCAFFELLNPEYDDSGYCENDQIENYVSPSEHVNCPHWKNEKVIRQKKLYFDTCPIRLHMDGVCYCSLRYCICDEDDPSDCPLFEEVE